MNTPSHASGNTTRTGVILTAARADTTICEVFGDLPTGLIPVNGKPIIFYILEKLFAAGIREVYIGVDHQQDKLRRLASTFFADKLSLHFVHTSKAKGPGDSLLTIFAAIGSGPVVVNLADTYVRQLDYSALDDAILLSTDFVDERKWATAEVRDGQVVRFKDKQPSDVNGVYALTGVYGFADVSLFQDFAPGNGNLEITALLQFYQQRRGRFRAVQTCEWLDFGHIDRYYASKNKLLHSRAFNTLEYNDTLGTITKRSRNVDKFRAEIKWQTNLPKNISVLAPRVIDYSLDDDPFIEMEFYSYPSLAEIWLFSEMNERVYFSIIDKLFTILDLFRQNEGSVCAREYTEVYVDKTRTRLAAIDNPVLVALLERDTVNVNGRQLAGWPRLCDTVFDLASSLYDANGNCFLHGDFCFSNILYDLRSGITRVIDPRGHWGHSAYGDIKYDIAKLRHSICGDYDYVVNDLYDVRIGEVGVDYQIYSSDRSKVKCYFDRKVASAYSLSQVQLIEGLLFLSMIPLHSDCPRRQSVMFAKSMELLNLVTRGAHGGPAGEH
ncbi:MAG: NTP transferase domain-containing protein [Gammaproteobacteria bacterium]|nr:NTP transferase domain-containing protein [Gammaproteobacteria bacterium]